MGRRHNRRLNDRLNELEIDPLSRPVAADHTDRYPDPEPVNGHIPDYVYETPFGRTVLGEVEQCGDTSQHTRSQRDAFEAFDDRGPLFDNETVCYGREDQNDPFDFDLGLDLF